MHYTAYNPNAFACNHNYTTNPKENNYLVYNEGWNYEGIAWYGVNKNLTVPGAHLTILNTTVSGGGSLESIFAVLGEDDYVHAFGTYADDTGVKQGIGADSYADIETMLAAYEEYNREFGYCPSFNMGIIEVITSDGKTVEITIELDPEEVRRLVKQ